MQYILSLGVDIHIEDDIALMVAAYYGNTDMCDFLIKNGADVNARNGQALLCAARGNAFDTVVLLRMHIDSCYETICERFEREINYMENKEECDFASILRSNRELTELYNISSKFDGKLMNEYPCMLKIQGELSEDVKYRYAYYRLAITGVYSAMRGRIERFENRIKELLAGCSLDFDDYIDAAMLARYKRQFASHEAFIQCSPELARRKSPFDEALARFLPEESSIERIERNIQELNKEQDERNKMLETKVVTLNYDERLWLEQGNCIECFSADVLYKNDNYYHCNSCGLSLRVKRQEDADDEYEEYLEEKSRWEEEHICDAMGNYYDDEGNYVENPYEED